MRRLELRTRHLLFCKPSVLGYISPGQGTRLRVTPPRDQRFSAPSLSAEGATHIMANPERNRDLSDNGREVGRPAPKRSGTASNVVPGFQPVHFGEIRSQGVALGWHIAAPSALRNGAGQRLFAEPICCGVVSCPRHLCDRRSPNLLPRRWRSGRELDSPHFFGLRYLALSHLLGV